jgi:hypothetical protein
VDPGVLFENFKRISPPKIKIEIVVMDDRRDAGKDVLVCTPKQSKSQWYSDNLLDVIPVLIVDILTPRNVILVRRRTYSPEEVEFEVVVRIDQSWKYDGSFKGDKHISRCRSDRCGYFPDESIDNLEGAGLE